MLVLTLVVIVLLYNRGRRQLTQVTGEGASIESISLQVSNSSSVPCVHTIMNLSLNKKDSLKCNFVVSEAS